jgi:hypothetical protein
MAAGLFYWLAIDRDISDNAPRPVKAVGPFFLSFHRNDN